MMFWSYFLDGSGIMTVLGIMLAIVYDIVATLSGGKLTTISAMVQHFGEQHRFWLLIFEGVFLGIMAALGIHFLWP
jgi:hypothetical protein